MKKIARLCNRVGKAMEKCWNSPADFDLYAAPCGDHFHVDIWPIRAEVYGGPGDGKRLIAPFGLDITKFLKCFDNTPTMVFTAMNGESPQVLFEGSLGGIFAHVSVHASPPVNAPIAERHHKVGPHAGQIERLK